MSECTAPPRLKPCTPGQSKITDPTPQVSVLRGERHKPFAWTATADEILAKVRIVQTNIKKLVANNAK